MIIDSPLKRELGLLNIVMITNGSVISAGMFIIPGIASARTGPSVVIGNVALQDLTPYFP